MLYSSSSQATKIAGTLNLTKQETHRNTARLVQVGLVRKNSEGLFVLTGFGKAVTRQFSFFEFLNRHKKFFENHTFENIPEKFVYRLGELEDTDLITSVANVFEKLKKLESGAKNYLKIMVPQAWAEEGEILLKLIKNNVNVKSLLAEHSVFPDEINQTIGKRIEKITLLKDNAEQRQVDKFGVAVYITEGPCAIMFPNKRDRIEMNSMFVGDNENLREWCNDVFDYYWSSSRPRVRRSDSNS